MKSVRWTILGINSAILIAAAGFGVYFFGGLGFWMQRLGVSEHYCLALYFEEIEIPSWNPKDYLPVAKDVNHGRKMEHYWAIWTRIPAGPLTEENDNKNELTPREILYKRVVAVRSVVYSSELPERSGCYLLTAVKGGGHGTYFFSQGDEFHIDYEAGEKKKSAVFEVSAIREVERDRKYEIIFENNVGLSVIELYERSVPLAFNIEDMINR